MTIYDYTERKGSFYPLDGQSYYTIYRTTNLINGKEYIGVHKQTLPEDDYLGSGKSIRRAIRKHGKENFRKEILFAYGNLEMARAKEIELVNDDYLKRDDVYNIVPGGNIPPVNRFIGQTNPFHGRNHTTETRQKISDANRGKRVGKNHPFYGRKHTEESLRKMSESSKNISDETRKRMSCAKKGKCLSENHSRASAEGHKDRTIRIFHHANGECFAGIKYDFVKKYALDQGSVSRLVRGKVVTVKGWRYIGPVNSG